MADTQSTTKFRADISQLRSEMQAASRLVKVANSEFKAATAGMDDWSKSADGLEKKIKQLNTILTAQKRQLALAKQEWEKTKKAYGENSAEADRAKIKLNNLEASVSKTEKELKNYEKELDAVGDESRETGNEIQQSSEGFTVMKGVLADLVATGIKAAIQGMKNLAGAAKEAYQEFDAGQDAMIKATGATGKEAEKLRETYKNVIKSVGGEFDQLGATIGEINTRMGFEDVDLEKATAEFQKFAKITGTDATEAVRLVSRAMGDAGIDVNQYGEVLDLLTTASQKSGIEIGTLAEQLTKYGAPMRNLGFDTKESVAIFSSWEKAGVNTQIAFSGMRKAISNWSKDGKDAREEFKKTLKEIESTPDRAKATQKAIEVFGSKAGPDLADAILEGRFAYEDFLSSLEGSTGTVDATFQETLDASDKIKLAMQGAKAEIGAFTAEILEKYEPQIEEAIQKATEKAKEIVSFVIQNKDAIIGALTAIGTVMGTVFVVDKVNTFMTTMKTFSGMIAPMAAKVGLLTAAEGAAEGATLGLNTALLANPATLIIGGIAGLIAIMLKFRGEQQKSLQETYGLTKAEEDLNKSIEKRYKTQKESNASRQESVDGIASESNYTRKLVDAYNELVDENGKVSKKNKEHADFILNQLAQALGVEKDQIDDLIGKNGKLGDSIDELISKRQAEATLEAYQDSYSEAKQNQTKALDDLANAHANYDEAVKKSEEAQKAYDEAYQKWMDDVAAGRTTMQNVPTDVMNLQQALDTTRTTLEQQKTALEQANQAYADSETTIKNYEALQEAVFSGDSTKINEQLSIMTNGLKTATSANRQELEKQVADRKAHYEKVKAAAASGNTAITQETVAEAKKQYQEAKKELDKMPEEYKEASGKSVDAYSGEAKKGKKKVESSTKSMAKGGVNTLKKEAKNYGPPGKTAVTNNAKTVAKNKSQVINAWNKLQSSGVQAAAKGAAKFKQPGKKGTTEYGSGIASGKGQVDSKVKGIATSAKSQFGSVSTYSSGQNFIRGFINGMGSLLSSVIEKAKSLVRAALNAVKKTQKEGSPSKETYKSGSYFTQGYINGITDRQDDLVKAVKGVVKNAVRTLTNVSNWNFSEVGASVSSALSNSISSSVSFAIDAISYEAEQKIAKIDADAEKLQKERDAKNAKLQKASDKKQKKLEQKINNKKTSKAEKNKAKKELAAEKKRVAKQIASNNKNYQKVVKEQKRMQEASSKMLSELQNAMSEYQAQAQALIDDTINGITEKYQQRYDELISKQDTLIEKMKSAGELFEISGAGVMTIGDLKEQTKAINDYAKKLQNIKSKVSAELFDQITTYDMKEGSAFLDRLLAMSTSDLQAYNKAYTEKMEAAQKAGESIYKADFTKIKTDYDAEITKAFKDLPKKLEALGTQVMKGFVDGFTKNTSYMDKGIKSVVNALIKKFKKSLGIKSPSKVMYEIGEYTIGGFTDALKDGIKQVQGIVEDIVTETATPLSNMDINPGTVRTVANGSLTAPASSTSNTVTNNYNLVQNNTSPKPLTALETYQARRRQVSMVKAMTQAV